MRSTTKDNFFILLAFIIMAVLFYSSSQPYGEQSLTGMLDEILAKEPLKNLLSLIQFNYAGDEVSIAAQGYSSFIEFFIRKLAHFGIYFLLGLCWFLGLKNKMTSIGLAALVSWLLASGYAAFDELHQSITPDRTPLMEDVILDATGALTSIFLAIVFFLFYSKKKKNRSLFKKIKR
ncbi:VanZ family protein [Carnobacterium sp. ISL-102]|uniref:VanZ family protein n=1 Tax=Carnobacterium sp. ISL-102 TaxID=2819142 RepID=UPI001BE7ACB0|nr:VanZ family protein [Carnobacterium sp. ISL-102]MBT2731301.1 VanZ family protein [Carnobacterium sp. ISL-102]